MLRTSLPKALDIFPKFLVPFRSGAAACEVVGVDMGCCGLQASCVKIDGAQVGWGSRASCQFAKPLLQHSIVGVAPSAKEVVQRLEAALPRQIDGGGRAISLVLPTSATVLRWPSKGNGKEIEKTLGDDLADSIGPGDSVEYCSWTLSSSGRRIIYAVSGGMSRAVAETMLDLGYAMPRVDSRPHCLARALDLDAIGGARVIIDWSWHDCSLLISSREGRRGGQYSQIDHQWPVPELCRPLHGYSLDSHERLGASKDQALQKRRDGERSLRQLLPLIRKAAEEITRTLRLAESIEGLDVSGPILVCGDAGAVPGFSDALAEALNCEVRGWRWGGAARPTTHSKQPDDALFAVAIAAACGVLR